MNGLNLNSGSAWSATISQLPENKKEDQILRWVPPVGKDAPVTASPGGFYVSYLGDVLQKLHTEEDGKDFQQLKDVVDDYKRQPFILSRVGMSRNRAAIGHPNPSRIWTPKFYVGVAMDCCSIPRVLLYYPMPQKLVDERLSKARKRAREKSKPYGPDTGATRKNSPNWKPYKRSQSGCGRLTKNVVGILWCILKYLFCSGFT